MSSGSGRAESREREGRTVRTSYRSFAPAAERSGRERRSAEAPSAVAVELRDILGGDITVAECQRHFGSLGKRELAHYLREDGPVKMRALIMDGRPKPAEPSLAAMAAAPAAAPDTAAKMQKVATGVVEALVGNQLGDRDSGLFKEMVGKVEVLLKDNFSEGEALLQKSLTAKTGNGASSEGSQEVVARLLVNAGAKKAGEKEEEGRRGERVRVKAPRVTAPLGSKMELVTLGIERGPGGRSAALGWAWEKGPEWDEGKLMSGGLRDEELLVEACAELVMGLVKRAEELAKASVGHVAVRLLATAEEIRSVQALTEGQWGSFVKTKLQGQPFPKVSWVPVDREQTESGSVLARKALGLVPQALGVAMPKPLLPELSALPINGAAMGRQALDQKTVAEKRRELVLERERYQERKAEVLRKREEEEAALAATQRKALLDMASSPGLMARQALIDLQEPPPMDDPPLDLDVPLVDMVMAGGGLDLGGGRPKPLLQGLTARPSDLALAARVGMGLGGDVGAEPEWRPRPLHVGGRNGGPRKSGPRRSLPASTKRTRRDD